MCYVVSYLKVFGIIIAGFFVISCFFLIPAKAQNSLYSPDAIAIRIIPNPEHKSAHDWYNDQDFSGSPQEIIVDGYSAVRDGRTVYVNAANVDGTSLYTNIYLISYNQNADSKTQDIFAAILKNWHFNSNLNTVGNCFKDTDKTCVLDEDCSFGDFCISQKARVIRDVKRWEDLYFINSLIDDYYSQNGRYPSLRAGSYLANISLSVWPSWDKVLRQDLGGPIPYDPVNRLGECSEERFNEISCWDENSREFDDSNPANDLLDLPPNSFSYVYHGEEKGQDYYLCAYMESGYISGAGSGACGDSNNFLYNQNIDNFPPVLSMASEIDVCSNSEFNYYIVAHDLNNDQLNWSFDFSPASQWASWPMAPQMENTSVAYIKLIHADQAGSIGVYNFTASVEDGQGGSDSKTFNFYVRDCNPPVISRITNANTGTVYYDSGSGQTSVFSIDTVIGNDLSLRIEASDPEGNGPLQYYFDNAPSGFNSSGSLDPNQEDYNVSGQIIDYTESYLMSLLVGDAGGARSAPVSFTINIINNPPIITSTPAADIRACVDYIYQLSANDPDGHSLTYSRIGTLPVGLVFYPNTGQLSGYPRSPGNSQIILSVSDQYEEYTRSPYSASADQAIAFNVQEEGYSISLPGNQSIHAVPENVPINELYYQNINFVSQLANNAQHGAEWEIFSSPSLSGFDLDLSPNSGLFSASANQAGIGSGQTVDITATAVNECGESHQGVFSLTAEPNAWCGDQDIQSAFGEECDDNDNDEYDDCLANCLLSYCGDGYIQNSPSNGHGMVEQCDGNNLNGRVCDDFGFGAGTLACDSSCVYDTSGCYVPGCETLTFSELWHWDGSDSPYPEFNQVMTSPMAADLDGDGTVEIVFNAFEVNSPYFPRHSDGRLRIINGADGSHKFTSTEQVNGGFGVALADLDNDGSIDIVTGSNIGVTQDANGDGRSDGIGWGVIAFENDATEKWRNDSVYTGLNKAPTIADLDQDGYPEVIINRSVLSGQTGALLWEAPSPGAVSAVADLDLDGAPEVIFRCAVYHGDGSLYWDRCSEYTGGYPAVANFDADEYPEVVHVERGSVSLREHTGSLIWEVVVPYEVGNPCVYSGDKSVCHNYGGGPPTIADFDNDNEPEIGVAGADYYTVFETDGSIRWRSANQDYSSAVTGSSVYDFNDDGEAEVLYNDEYYFRVYRGSTGQILMQVPNGSGTLIEYPIVVDANGDGQAEIVVAANDYTKGNHHGIRAFGNADPSCVWVNARQIWNQHAYHVTNINDDGTVPANENNSWLWPSGNPYNSYRQNILVDNQIQSCADQMVSGSHLLDDCAAAGGELYNLGECYFICRFDASTCPSGWTQYENWSTILERSINIPNPCPSGGNPVNAGITWDDCRTCAYGIRMPFIPSYPFEVLLPAHGWENSPAECVYNSSCSACNNILQATITQIGCY